MAKHDWPFDFPRHANPREDLSAQDIYELIIRAVAIGTQEATRTERLSGTGQTADQIAASLARGRLPELIKG